MEVYALEKRLLNKLSQRKEENAYRTLIVSDEGAVDFSSNDYLGLARNKALAQLVKQEYDIMPVKNGSGGSRLLGGNSASAEELELLMAAFFHAPATLLFNSGYAANQALLSAVPQKGDTILVDELSHASIKEGIRLSQAKRFSFRHNDISHLEHRLKQAQGQAFVVVESIYSMDGDAAPLADICTVCEKYGAAMIVDEAHSTGIYGKGSGLVCELGLQEKVFARVYTFGKGMGCHGACIAGSAALKNYLINFARPFIYTTALPQHTVVSLKMAFLYLQQHPELTEQIHGKVHLFNKLKSLHLNKLLPSHIQVHSNSPLQAIVYPGAKEIKRLALEMEERGFPLRPIYAPTVPAGKERLRISLHVHNSDNEIEDLVITLAQCLK